jgi:hypothetical protein
MRVVYRAMSPAGSKLRSTPEGPRQPRARVVAAAAVGVLALYAVIGGGPATAESVPQPDGREVPPAATAPGAGPWRVLAPPVPTDRRSTLADADPVGTSSAWAAGWIAASPGDGDFPRRPLVVRLVGDRWVSTDLTDVDAGGEYERGVAAAGPSEAWLAGMDGDGVVTRRWNGTTWTRVPFGLTADEGGWLESGRIAAAPGRAWLITTGIFDGYSHSRVAAWDGSAWTWLPDVTETYGDLYDIDAAGRDAVWVVGGSFDKGFALQWNGTRWVDRLPGRSDLNLLRLHVVSRNSVWVYGERTGGPQVEHVLLHWNGTRWTERVVPGGVFSGGVTATTDGAVWVVARGDVPDRTRYLRYSSGSGFRAVDGPARTDAFSVQVADLVTLPGRGEPLMVGQAHVLGAPAAAASEARRAGAL